MDPLIINFTPTGMIPTKAMTPYVPISPAEIIEQTHEVFELGITCVHLHARDAEGKPTQEVSFFAKIVEGIRTYCPGLVVCVSLSGREISDPILRAAPLELKPDMASLTLSSLNFNKQASINTPQTIHFLLEKILECGARPEFEVFDTGMLNYALYLIKKNTLSGPFYFNFILGGVATAQFDPELVHYMLKKLPPDSNCALGGIGDSQLAVHEYALTNNLGVRVGLEDTIYMSPARDVLATNFDLVQRIHALAQLANRTIMTPEKFRKLGYSNSFNV